MSQSTDAAFALSLSSPPTPTTSDPIRPSTSASASTGASSPAPPASRNVSSPALVRPSSSHRETFSAPPLVSRYAHSPGPSVATTAPSTRPGTATSSALALVSSHHSPHVSVSHIPGLASPLLLPTPSADADLGPVSRTAKDAPLKSHLLTGTVEKPWLAHKDARARTSYWITLLTSFLGIVAGAGYCFLAYRNVPLITRPLCPVLQENFDTFSVDSPGATWRHEVDLGGFGNGEFQMTTASPANSFVRDGKLFIVPTLTADAIPGGNASVFDGYTYNATGCTSTTNNQGTGCGAVSNHTAGTIINPVQSARLTTQFSHNIQYGKVEVRARVPKGDWLWPAIWMLPVNDTYGPWPLSGEIDIMESRGNGPSYPAQGSNVVRGSLNWGPTHALNSVFRTYGWWSLRRSSYHQQFHTYTLEWTPDFLRIYVDTRLYHMLDLRFNIPFFTRGKFPPTVTNDSHVIALENPWIGRGNSAPFDRPFFLILDVAVGGTNGWFPDNVGGKPWVDGSPTAMRDFALAQNKWYPTWPKNVEDRAMVVDYVKMWQLC